MWCHVLSAGRAGSRGDKEVRAEDGFCGNHKSECANSSMFSKYPTDGVMAFIEEVEGAVEHTRRWMKILTQDRSIRQKLTTSSHNRASFSHWIV